MDDFPGLLARDFGYRPQGKSAPMSAAKSSPDVGSLRSQPRSSWSTGISGDLSPPAFDDVFAPPPSFSKPASVDSIFDGFGDPVSHTSHDKPVYDDDLFDGVPGVKNPVSDDFDNVFAGMSTSNRPPSVSAPSYDDIFENLGKVMPERGPVDAREVKEQGGDGFEELIPGFGGSSPQRQSKPSEHEQQSAASSDNLTAEDPFAVLETNPTSAHPSSVLFPDPLEQINRPMDSGSPKKASLASGGLFDDEELTNTTFMSKIHEDPLATSSLETEEEPSQRSFMETFENIPPKVHPTKSSDSLKTDDRNGGQNYDTSYNPYERHDMADPSPKAYEQVETADEVWLTVAEIPLFTEPTSGPPPSRPPPPVGIRQTSYGKSDQFYSDGFSSKVRDTYSSSQSTQTYHGKNVSSSPLDDLEDFVLGKPQRYANEHSEVRRVDEEFETNSAAAAMKEAMDKAEAKFKHAVRERERDAKSAKGREPERKERFEKAMTDTQYPEEDEEKRDRLAQEQEQRERDEKEEQKRRQKEREQTLERERARQAVERATREARERASVEARRKAERAAVEKANAEARQRAERAAFQKASTEARERAAVEAREKAERERAAAEARERERAAAEAREKERAAAEASNRERATVRERAAVERAAQEARTRAQRAAVERVTAEARERAAAEAQRRSASTTATREKQQKTEIDVESFFNFGARPSSAPKQRNPTSEAGFEAQFQNKGFSDGLQRTSTGTSSTIRKAQPTVNLVDDLASIFGAPSSSGDFQEVDGETEERRRARLERHQRTLERTAKALAEKNERDMQVQRDQAERHRIAETLDFEIKRWAAGKEGNLRALLSTLHYVLWPECGWQPVSLTDLITVASVKKVYRKATLCIHPDKVQQKGATLQQKYIAEKVFDLLKEAWNKVNSEELM